MPNLSNWFFFSTRGDYYGIKVEQNKRHPNLWEWRLVKDCFLSTDLKKVGWLRYKDEEGQRGSDDIDYECYDPNDALVLADGLQTFDDSHCMALDDEALEEDLLNTTTAIRVGYALATLSLLHERGSWAGPTSDEDARKEMTEIIEDPRLRWFTIDDNGDMQDAESSDVVSRVVD